MIEPHVHIAYAPRGAGLLCAAFWFVQGDDVYGWSTGARGGDYPSFFFVLEAYYSTRDTVCYRSAQNDVHGGWFVVSTEGESPIGGTGPVPAALRPELERMQDAFVREWLFYRDDPTHHEEAQELRARELPVLAVNLRPKKLSKLAAGAPVWRFSTPGADLNIITFLGRRWTFDYAPQ
jgi:hypothetical protein